MKPLKMPKGAMELSVKLDEKTAFRVNYAAFEAEQSRADFVRAAIDEKLERDRCKLTPLRIANLLEAFNETTTAKTVAWWIKTLRAHGLVT